ncbi:MAG: ASKHA domain-containing protein, partial [Thermoguttaceae bacterium]
RRSEESGRPEFVLVSAGESGGARDVVITQADVDNLIRAKAAIYAAADSLVQSLGLTFAQIDKLYIAGGFGNELDISHCVRIGLLPDIPLEKIQFVGNSSAAGTRLAMLSRALFDEIHRVRRQIAYRELAVDPDYMERFTSACFLPHTDLSRFPTVSEGLRKDGVPAGQPSLGKSSSTKGPKS